MYPYENNDVAISLSIDDDNTEDMTKLLRSHNYIEIYIFNSNKHEPCFFLPFQVKHLKFFWNLISYWQ